MFSNSYFTKCALRRLPPRYFRGVTLDPPPDGDVVGVQALLGQQLFFNAPLRLPDSDGLDGVFSPMALVTITNIAAQLAFGRRKR